jgi:hypothetical protein
VAWRVLQEASLWQAGLEALHRAGLRLAIEWVQLCSLLSLGKKEKGFSGNQGGISSLVPDSPGDDIYKREKPSSGINYWLVCSQMRFFVSFLGNSTVFQPIHDHPMPQCPRWTNAQLELLRTVFGVKSSEFLHIEKEITRRNCSLASLNFLKTGIGKDLGIFP